MYFSLCDLDMKDGQRLKTSPSNYVAGKLK